MKIGIDISQLAYQNTGVANFLYNLVAKLIERKEYTFVLFFSSLRRDVPRNVLDFSQKPNVSIKKIKFPPEALNILWNKLHVFPIEKFIGDVDFFITSDWTEPPTKKTKKGTILYDLIVYKNPEETARNIVNVQKKKLSWVKKESDIIFCISEATKKDAVKILEIDEKKLKVIYPGLTL